MTQTEREESLEEALCLERVADDLAGDIAAARTQDEANEIQEQIADLYRSAQRIRKAAQA